MSFKLIAIRPLSECNSNFLKNLQPNYIYQLDQNYNFYDFNNNILDDTVSENLIEKINIQDEELNLIIDGLSKSTQLLNETILDLGKVVIIHDMPDDFTTQPSGNSGTKIACGKIKKAF